MHADRSRGRIDVEGERPAEDKARLTEFTEMPTPSRPGGDPTAVIHSPTRTSPIDVRVVGPKVVWDLCGSSWHHRKVVRSGTYAAHD